MPDFLVIPAQATVGTRVTAATDANAAATQACQQRGVTSGVLAVVDATAVQFVKVQAGSAPVTISPAQPPNG